MQLTAITDFIFAGELLFFAGLLFVGPKKNFSAAWFWQWTIILMALAAFFGGIDHGFLQPIGEEIRIPVRRIVWVIFGLMSLTILQTWSKQFLTVKMQRLVSYISILQFVIYSVFGIFTYLFIYSALNVLPTHLVLLGACVLACKKNKKYLPLIIGLVVTLVASIVQMLGIDLFYPLDRNGLYHIIAMIGAYYLYKGGLVLKTNK